MIICDFSSSLILVRSTISKIIAKTSEELQNEIKGATLFISIISTGAITKENISSICVLDFMADIIKIEDFLNSLISQPKPEPNLLTALDQVLKMSWTENSKKIIVHLLGSTRDHLGISEENISKIGPSLQKIFNRDIEYIIAGKGELVCQMIDFARKYHPDCEGIHCEPRKINKTHILGSILAPPSNSQPSLLKNIKPIVLRNSLCPSMPPAMCIYPILPISRICSRISFARPILSATSSTDSGESMRISPPSFFPILPFPRKYQGIGHFSKAPCDFSYGGEKTSESPIKGDYENEDSIEDQERTVRVSQWIPKCVLILLPKLIAQRVVEKVKAF